METQEKLANSFLTLYDLLPENAKMEIRNKIISSPLDPAKSNGKFSENPYIKSLPERAEPSHDDLNSIFGAFRFDTTPDALIEQVAGMRKSKPIVQFP